MQEINIELTLGGRPLSRRTFSIEEAGMPLGEAILEITDEEPIEYDDLFVTMGNEREVQVTRWERSSLSLMDALEKAAAGGKMEGATFTIDATTEHEGAL